VTKGSAVKKMAPYNRIPFLLLDLAHHVTRSRTPQNSDLVDFTHVSVERCITWGSHNCQMHSLLFWIYLLDRSALFLQIKHTFCKYKPTVANFITL